MAQRTCPGCRKLQRRVAELEALVRDLQARLGQNSSNSSRPPSADPPGAAPPVVKEPTGRKRGAAEVLETIFQVPRALGTVSAVEEEAAAALAGAHAEAGRAVQQAACKNTDETGWKRAGKRCWLWTAVTNTVAYFLIQPSRGA